MSAKYLWVRFSRDSQEGYYVSGPLTREELVARIASDTRKNKHGDWENGKFTGFISAEQLARGGLDGLAGREHHGKVLVLRVEVVTPTPIQVVEQWEIPE